MWGFLKRLLWGRNISQKSYKKFQKYMKDISARDVRQQIIDYDKLYHHILRDMGYAGSFGEILKRDPREIPNINDIWRLHKLRNELVHDFSEKSESFLKKNALEYEKNIRRFLKKIVR